ncbi:hypothetical protein ACIBCU_04045 [Streptomyces sp. NPDC051064]|uniref:hypothetical protein n=1 Tax=Streptomyces sp. NPDC051064 TaxID=3365641 RepID=UPI003789B137
MQDLVIDRGLMRFADEGFDAGLQLGDLFSVNNPQLDFRSCGSLTLLAVRRLAAGPTWS